MNSHRQPVASVATEARGSKMQRKSILYRLMELVAILMAFAIDCIPPFVGMLVAILVAHKFGWW